MYYGKRRRRGALPAPGIRNLMLMSAFLSAYFFLFFAPLHWTLLFALYLGACGWSAWAMIRPERAVYFRAGAASPESLGRDPMPQAMLAAGMAILPLVYIVSLFRSIGELETFSIHLPSDVYTDGLRWTLYALPFAAIAGYLAWKSSFKPGLRTLIFFYGSVLVVLAWILVWERIDLYLAAYLGGADRSALFFSFRTEQHFRSAVKAVFYGSAFILGIGYLTGSARTSVFAKRALFIGLPSLVLYANMLFFLGDWNHLLAGLRDRGFAGHHYGAFRMAARSQLARTPSAYSTPFLLEQWAELEYQAGDKLRSAELLSTLSRNFRGKPYYASLVKEADRSLASMAAPGTGASLELDLPLIKPASYLDQEWYAILSAVAFLKPSWTDLELKKRLLDLSSTVQLHLPKLDNIPELIPALRQLDIPSSTCFITSDRIKSALAAGNVPFISLYGRWAPVSGYDPGRDGFYYHAYEPAEDAAWFRNEETDLFQHRAGDAFGGEAERRRSREGIFSLRKFISRQELEEHVLDVGGVGIILGDSSVADAAEREAAFLVEMGDTYYQDHGNFAEAAAAYGRAAKLYPDDQVFSRMIYLKRRYWETAADQGDYRNLFRQYPPEWMENLGPDKQRERQIVAKLIRGELGSYLMLNWYVAPLPDSSEESQANLDTALSLFRELHKRDPEEPIYTDSLATLLTRRGDLKAGEALYSELSELYPFGSESAVYRLAWIKLKLGKVGELPDLLSRCDGFSEEARFLTMKAAVAMSKGQYRRAYASLSHSLKLDKSIGETHALLADYYRRRGDKTGMQVHLNWQRRST